MPGDPVSYDVFAPHFDAWQRSFGCAYDDLVEGRVTAMLERHAPGARRVVDLGIGTGDLAIALARRGLVVVGVDRAPAMLAVAAGKAVRAGVTVELVRQDLRALRLPVPVDAAVCVYTVVNQLTDERDLAAALRAVRAALVPGGLFVFELNLPESYDRYWTGTHDVDVGDAVIVRTHRRRPGSLVIEATVSIRRRTCGGWDEATDRILQRPWADAEIERSLAGSGFVVVERDTYDPFGAASCPAPARPTKALWACRRV